MHGLTEVSFDFVPESWVSLLVKRSHLAVLAAVNLIEYFRPVLWCVELTKPFQQLHQHNLKLDVLTINHNNLGEVSLLLLQFNAMLCLKEVSKLAEHPLRQRFTDFEDQTLLGCFFK